METNIQLELLRRELDRVVSLIEKQECRIRRDKKSISSYVEKLGGWWDSYNRQERAGHLNRAAMAQDLQKILMSMMEGEKDDFEPGR